MAIESWKLPAREVVIFEVFPLTSDSIGNSTFSEFTETVVHSLRFLSVWYSEKNRVEYVLNVYKVK